MSQNISKNAWNPAPIFDERRTRTRIETALIEAVIRTIRGAAPCMVVNISDCGALITGASSIAIGEPVRLELGTAQIDARVVRTTDGETGLAFDRPVNCYAILRELIDAAQAPAHAALCSRSLPAPVPQLQHFPTQESSTRAAPPALAWKNFD